jgi:hypothetical protein
MYRSEMQKLEGIWTGTEWIEGDDGESLEATGRWEFRTVFDGRFLVCDYVQTAPNRPTSVGHAVFRKDDASAALMVSWFRSPSATSTQQAVGVAEGERLVFVEKIANESTRTTYSVALNKLTVITERSVAGSEWKPVFKGSYGRPRG